jgi:hypothetical protein
VAMFARLFEKQEIENMSGSQTDELAPQLFECFIDRAGGQPAGILSQRSEGSCRRRPRSNSRVRGLFRLTRWGVIRPANFERRLTFNLMEREKWSMARSGSTTQFRTHPLRIRMPNELGFKLIARAATCSICRRQQRRRGLRRRLSGMSHSPASY